MLGLIKKDLLLLKSNLVYFFVIALIYSLLIVEGTFGISFILVLPIIAVIMFLSTFSYDDFNKWDAYAVTLPVLRKNIIKSKYIATLIIILASSLFGLLISLLISVLPNQIFSLDIFIEEFLSAILGAIIFISIMFPLIYKIGIEQARISVFVVVVGLLIVFNFLGGFIDFSRVLDKLNSLNDVWFIVIPIISMLFILVSYIITSRIYLKKEF